MIGMIHSFFTSIRSLYLMSFGIVILISSSRALIGLNPKFGRFYLLGL